MVEVLATWAELSALSEDDGAVMRGDVLDSMRDSQLYADTAGSADDRDSASAGSSAAVVSDMWTVLERRRLLLGEAWPFDLSTSSLTRPSSKKAIEQVAAYTAVALIEAASSKWYPTLSISPGDQIRTWFEYIVAASAGRLLGGVTCRFGAPFPEGWPVPFPERVQHLARQFELEAREAELVKYSSPEQQDDSLDLVARWRITDEEGGSPYLLFQCATGEKWKTDKAGQPSMELWKAYISWNGPQYKAIAVPFTLRARGELENISIRHQYALVFDRLRIAFGRPDDGIEDSLRTKLVQWCRSKFETFRDEQANIDLAGVHEKPTQAKRKSRKKRNA